MWHDSFMCVTWLFHLGTGHLCSWHERSIYMWHDSWHERSIYMWHDSWHERSIYMWHDAFVWMMTHSCETWIFRMGKKHRINMVNTRKVTCSDVTRSYMGHDWFTRVIWPMYMCGMTYLFIYSWLCSRFERSEHACKTHKYRKWPIYVTCGTLIHVSMIPWCVY